MNSILSYISISLYKNFSFLFSSEPTIKEKKTKKKYKTDKQANRDLVELPPVLHQRKKFFVLEGKKPHKLRTVPKISTKDEEFLSKMEFQELGKKSKLPSISPDF